MKYAITLASFRKLEPIEDTLATLAKHGYNTIEMFGEPNQVDTKKLLDSLNSYGFSVCGVTDMCNTLGGHEMNVCLFADDIQGIDRTHRIISAKEKELFATQAIPIMRRLCRKATDYGIQLVLEPLNRYSTPYCATAKDAIAIAQQVDSLGVLLDTFHMNIEEDLFEDAIQSSREFLRHMHFADNNRKMPGFAHIDFSTIVKSLIGIGYDGYISFEPNIPDKSYEHATRYGLDFIKRIVKLQDKSTSA